MEPTTDIPVLLTVLAVVGPPLWALAIWGLIKDFKGRHRG